jgi:hypothetical protein
MQLKQYQDIYRGLVIDYDINREEDPSYWVLREPNNIEPLHKAMSYDAACDWIDKHVKNKLSRSSN